MVTVGLPVGVTTDVTTVKDVDVAVLSPTGVVLVASAEVSSEEAGELLLLET